MSTTSATEQLSVLRTQLGLSNLALADWADFSAELTELLADYLPEVDGDGTHQSVLIDCVRAALVRAHEMGAVGEACPQTQAVV
jgi:hypothetical protein